MINKIAVWSDSVLEGVVLDEVRKRYVKLKEKCCVATVSKAINIPIINNAKFGMTSEKGKQIMQKNLEEGLSCDAAIICFGGNDVDHDWAKVAKNPDLDHLPTIPINKFYENISFMVKTLKEKNIIPVLVTIPPIIAKRYFDWFSKNIENSENIIKFLGDIEYIYRSHELYAEAIIKISKEFNCRLIDIRQEFLKTRNISNLFCSDGIHPNELGHQLMGKVFLEYANNNL